jgi:hypothetical protein
VHASGSSARKSRNLITRRDQLAVSSARAVYNMQPWRLHAALLVLVLLAAPCAMHGAQAATKPLDMAVWHEALLSGQAAVQREVPLPPRLAQQPITSKTRKAELVTDAGPSVPAPDVPPPVLDLPAMRELITALFHVSSSCMWASMHSLSAGTREGCAVPSRAACGQRRFHKLHW